MCVVGTTSIELQNNNCNTINMKYYHTKIVACTIVRSSVGFNYNILTKTEY